MTSHNVSLPRIPGSLALGMGAAIYVLAWSFLPPLLSASLPLDVVESLAWGREWEWGYYKHPPLAPWVLHLFYVAFGKAGPFLLSQLCIATTLWMVWRTGCRLMAHDRAFLGTVLTMGVAYYTGPALEFNHNVAQMPVWAALGYCLVACLQEGRPRQWLALGLVAGLGLLTKYSVVVLLACQGLYLMLTSERRVLRQSGPWLAVVVMLAVLVPHMHWLWQLDWLPMSYASARAVSTSASPRLDAFRFLGAQILNHLPLALIVAAALLGTRQERRVAPAAQAAPAAQGGGVAAAGRSGYLLVLALGPGLLVTLLGLVTGKQLRDMWGMPMWAFSGLLVAAWLPAHWLAPMRPWLLRGLAVWLVLVSLLAGAYLAYGAQWRNHPSRTDWPQAALAREAQATWLSVADCRLDTVASDYWLAGLISVASTDWPSILIAGNERFSPWVNQERLRRRGALWVWQSSDVNPAPPPPLDRLQPGPDLRWHEGLWQVAWPYAPAGKPLTVHWRAYVPAACERQS